MVARTIAQLLRTFSWHGALRPFLIIAILAAATAAVSPATNAEVITTPHNYHWQQTNFACGTASIEMMLDSPAVRNNNANVNNMFNNLPGDGNLVNGVQASIYQASRDRRQLLFNTYGYVGYHPGTDPIEFSYTINAYDGIANGPALPGGVAQGGNPNHAYGWYGFLPGFGDRAMRTVAYALKNYGVPATAAVDAGGHWVVVDGVTTTGNVPTPQNPNSQYKITGVYIADPWTGYAESINLPKKDRGLGKGGTENGKDKWNWKSYREWGNAFTPVKGPVGFPYPFSGQYNIVIEPPDYDVPFAIDNGIYSSEPIYPDLPAPLTAGTALNDALAEIGVGGDFHSVIGGLDGNQDFVGGTWDTGNIGFYDFPTDTGGEGGWMIPYIGAGGSNDVLGAVVVNSIDGSLDDAVWLGGDSWTLADLHGYYDGYYDLNFPLDQPQGGVPEPASLLLFAIGGVALLRLRWKYGR